jgi:hypothetical protein
VIGHELGAGAAADGGASFGQLLVRHELGDAVVGGGGAIGEGGPQVAGGADAPAQAAPGGQGLVGAAGDLGFAGQGFELVGGVDAVIGAGGIPAHGLL